MFIMSPTIHQERESLAAASAAQLAGATERLEELGGRHRELNDSHAELKEKLKSLKAELGDTRAKLELRDYEAGLREAKDAAAAAALEELGGKVKGKADELEAARRTLKVGVEGCEGMCKLGVGATAGNVHAVAGMRAQGEGLFTWVEAFTVAAYLQLPTCSIAAAAQAAEERATEAEARARELYECNKRLEVHVGVSLGPAPSTWRSHGHRAVLGGASSRWPWANCVPRSCMQELESRKRAPLYQKKQEEELKAAVEKAQECEVRAIEAELRAKQAAAETEAAQKLLAELQGEVAATARAAARSAEEAAEKHALEVQRLSLESAVTQVRWVPCAKAWDYVLYYASRVR